MRDPAAPTSQHVVLLSIPNLRTADLSAMGSLSRHLAGGEVATLVPSFPAVTCPVQANMTTGKLPREHGIVANGFFWRDREQVEMWTSWNDCIQRPQIWDLLHEQDPSIRSAVWFALHSKGSGADFICTPAPIHEPGGTESMWCYTRPEGLYEQLREKFGDFPLHHFWGPLAGIQSTRWIVESAVELARKQRPNFFYIYLPHLDYAAQKNGPNSRQARAAVRELDEELGRLFDGLSDAYGDAPPLLLVASEYVIVPTDEVVYPNRLLRDAGLLKVREEDDGGHLDVEESRAWALADHQVAHVFVRDQDEKTIRKVKNLFAKEAGVAEALTGEALAQLDINHPRSGDVVLVSQPNSWFAYYWWNEPGEAPEYARTVDIHRKPGYDPVELFLDRKKATPLDAKLVKGSHGAPAFDASQQGVLLSSAVGTLGTSRLRDYEVARVVLQQFQGEFASL